MVLKAEKREKTGRQASAALAGGRIPAVVYGHGFDNESISISQIDFAKVLQQAGESTLVDVQVGANQVYKVIIQAVQRHPVTDNIIHADLRRVRLDEKIEADIPLVFEGTPPAVKELGGILVTPLSVISVKALPQDLVHEFKVDVTMLKTFDDVIRVKDLGIAAIFEVLSPPEAAVALVEEPRQEEISTEKPAEVLPEGAEEKAPEGDKKDEGGADAKQEKKDN